MVAKYRAVAEVIAEKIRTGSVSEGERLPAEAELAEQFQVSRATIRSALAHLNEAGLVETHNGSGSFVRIDDHAMPDSQGWTEALAERGLVGPVRLIAFGKVLLPETAASWGLDDPTFLVTERVRSVDGAALTYERSRVPWRASLEGVVQLDQMPGSLLKILKDAGILPVRYSERYTVAAVGQEEADLLGTQPGAAYLRSERLAYDADNRLVEQVISLLDPKHFSVNREGTL